MVWILHELDGFGCWEATTQEYRTPEDAIDDYGEEHVHSIANGAAWSVHEDDGAMAGILLPKPESAEPKVLCEKVTIDPGEDANWYLVQYEDTPEDDRERSICLAHLRDCGHAVTTESHPVVGPNDEPAVSWSDLSDIIDPCD